MLTDVLNACDSKPNEKPVCNSKPVEKCCSSQANNAANAICFDTKENIPSAAYGKPLPAVSFCGACKFKFKFVSHFFPRLRRMY